MYCSGFRRASMRMIYAVTIVGAAATCLVTGSSAQTAAELPVNIRAKLYALGFPRYINADPTITQAVRDGDAVASWRRSVKRAPSKGLTTPQENDVIQAQAMPALFGAVIGRPGITAYGRVAKFPTRKDAEAAAMLECQKRGGEAGCSRGTAVADDQCVGYAAGPSDKGQGNRGFAAFNADPAEAKKSAVASCQKALPAAAAKCEAVVALCAGGRE
jgi:Domain of unknown function (DUF4189)